MPDRAPRRSTRSPLALMVGITLAATFVVPTPHSSAIVRGLSRSRITPNALTVLGLLTNIGCGVLYGYGHFFAAGLLMILANLFDMFDGQVARLRGRVTRFGAFFDSVIDRYSDVIVYVGIMVFYARNTAAHSTLLVALKACA